MASVVLTQQTEPQALWLGEILETIDDFGEASIGLVAWELSLPEQALGPAWFQAVAAALIEATGRCDQTGEVMYRLVPFVAPAGL